MSSCIELAESIKQRGMLQPVMVMPYDPAMRITTGKDYLLIMGYRRFTACEINKYETIDAIIREDISSFEQAQAFNLIENLKRENLNPVEESNSIRFFTKLGLQRAEIADQIQKSPGWVQVRMQLLDLPEIIRDKIAIGLINVSSVRRLYSVYLKQGMDKTLEFAAKLMDAHADGKNAKTVKAPVAFNYGTHALKKRVEISLMTSHLLGTIGEGMATYALGWASGFLTYTEFFEKCEAHAKEHGRFWEPLDMEE